MNKRVSEVPDQIFENPRLVTIYDTFDGQREDLAHFYAIVEELDSKSILDVGCGTGSFACLLGKNGFEVFGVDPAGASLELARCKPFANHVRWFQGDAT